MNLLDAIPSVEVLESGVARDDHHVANSAQAPHVHALANEWGWEKPSQSILDMANKYLQLKSLRSGEYLVAIGAMKQAEVDELLRIKPDNRRTLDWISEHRRDVMPFIDPFLAMSVGVAWYDSLEEFSLHSSVDSRDALYECDEGEFVVLATDAGRPVVVFGSSSAYHRYLSLGRVERANSVIARKLHRSRESDQFGLMAISRRDLVSSWINFARSELATHASISESSAVWLGSSAENQARQETRELARMLDTALKHQVTDIAFKPAGGGAVSVLMRQYGDLRVIGSSVMQPEIAQKAISFLMSRSGANPSGARLRQPADGNISYRSPAGEAQLRLSFIPLGHYGEVVPQISVSIRILKQEQANIELSKLQLDDRISDDIRYAIRLTQGLIILAGPTNTGKSTTIAGAVGEHVSLYRDTRKRLSVEDPVERIVHGVTQIQAPVFLEEEERWNVLTRAIKRHDPDVLWLGEVRDEETARACVTYASSGHLVFSTIHATDSLVACDVLAKMVPPEVRFQLAESMLLMVSQRLVKRLCHRCRDTRPIREDEIMLVDRYARSLGQSNFEIPEQVADAVGCPHCVNGYDGILPINESLPFTRTTRDAWQILLDRPDISARNTMAQSRSLTLLQASLARVAAFEIDLKSILV